MTNSKRKHWNILIIIIIAILVCVLVFSLLKLNRNSNKNQFSTGSDKEYSVQLNSSETAIPIDNSVNESVSSDSEKEAVKSEIQKGEIMSFQINSDVEIQTPYCTLHYPQKWADKLKVVSVKTDNNYKVYFIGLIDSTEVPLFDISFGDTSEMPVGTLKQPDGSNVVVHLNLEVFSPDDGWSDKVSETASQMVSDSNYTTETLSMLDNFS